jgi:hypothetical protein
MQKPKNEESFEKPIVELGLKKSKKEKDKSIFI